MCGIAGVWDLDARSSRADLEATAARMAGTLRHRGPDDEGTWVDPDVGVAFGHRRLSIVDLSPAGHQPMVSATSRYVVTFNGEIYNFAALRDDLVRRGHSFRGTSDTEVVMAGCEEWGFRGALDRFNGMFALALWDTREGVLHLARDRVGEKPLYYGWAGRTLVFGSQLGALRAHPALAGRLEIDRDALAAYLRLNYVPAPHCIYKGVAKLAAGTVLSLRQSDGDAPPAPESYWSLADVVRRARSGGGPVGEAEAVDELDGLLRDAIRLRMHADVPLGAFLSGGIDSSTVVAIMQAESVRPVRTFTVGFADPELDESLAAGAVAQHLGTDHTRLELSPRAALEIVPRLPAVYDEPFADPSQLPTMAIAEMARRHVTVCLSGDGGDEVFGGYNRYTQGSRAWSALGSVPDPIRRMAARAILAAPGAGLGRVLPAAKAQKLARVLDAKTETDVYTALVSAWESPQTVVVGAREPQLWPAEEAVPNELAGIAERMMFLDALSTLPDEMLAKVDRASMAVALELRVPLLDPRLVELAWALPLDMRIRAGKGKWLLRQVLHRYVPPALVDRPKKGFDPPIAAWLRGPLRPWAETLLQPARLRAEGYLDADAVTRCWIEHLAGRRNWDYRLWSVLMFQAWLDGG